ncbi:hypothetical protein [Rhodoferax sp. U11-2br]|uniref:hypothetical protein n=1 Tax=Rhodoferax sp. U11-2br TaxID=2838878 RepID=UPI001BE779B2|nr:hypothetical protein [Rhodoferax sp. U11-2br]MBT3065291.1 hypothetical protein [Rhodoferax sp. U11-2br]
MSSYEERWERFLNPELVRPSLFMATMFITTFEILKNSAIDRIRDFFSTGWSEEGSTVSQEYETKVLSRNRSALYASLSWVHEYQVINDQDLETFELLKKTRNLLAHKLFEVVTGQTESNHTDQFPVLVELLRKIEVWWVVNVEIPSNPDYADADVDEEGIVPGPILSLQMLLEVASGNTELLEGWRRGRAKLHRRAQPDTSNIATKEPPCA